MPRLVLLLGLLLPVTPAVAGPATTLEIEWPERRLWVGADKVEGIVVMALDDQGQRAVEARPRLRVDGLSLTSSIAFVDGVAKLPPVKIESEQVKLQTGSLSVTAPAPILNGWLSLIPAFLAIALALITRQVLLSLAGGILSGVMLLKGSFVDAFTGSLDLLVAVTADADKVKTVLFTLLMGGLVGLVSANGGARGVVDRVAKFATTARSGSIATWALGMLVFFDDYASSLLVGTTMRPITDKLKISREKLSYLVDSTAAPISSLALVSTWIGYEVSVLQDALQSAGIERDGYEVFLSGMSTRFYQVFALAFVFLVGWMGRDFGPMLKAERRARLEGKVLADFAVPLMDADLAAEADAARAAPPRAMLFVLPIAVLVFTVLYVLGSTGFAATITDPAGWTTASASGWSRKLGFILGNAASFDALVYGGAAGAATAALLSIGLRAQTLAETMDSFVRGLRAMLLAVVVLCLAWCVGRVMQDLRAGAFVAEQVGPHLPSWSIATVSFLLAAVMAFATGTSWGTMAILFPVLTPIAALYLGTPDFETILLGATSAVLAGAVFGDHCSPISDTTVLSSIASAADHVDHTRTQAPYALLVGTVSIVLGTLPHGLGVPAWICWILGLGALVGLLRLFGKRPEVPESPDVGKSVAKS